MSTFGWCLDGHHNTCARSYKRFHFEKRGKGEVLVHTGEVVYCECPKRGCDCYKKAADRSKPKTRRRKA